MVRDRNRTMKYLVYILTFVLVPPVFAHMTELRYQRPNGDVIVYTADSSGVYRNVRYGEDCQIPGTSDWFIPVFPTVRLSHPDVPSPMRGDPVGEDGVIIRHPLYSPIHNHVHTYTTNRGDKWHDYFNIDAQEEPPPMTEDPVTPPVVTTPDPPMVEIGPPGVDPPNTQDPPVVNPPSGGDNGNGGGGQSETVVTTQRQTVGDCGEVMDDAVSYTMELYQGYNFISIPLMNPMASCTELNNVSDLLTVLGDSANRAYSPAHPDNGAFYTEDGYSVDKKDAEITPTLGFVVVMNNAVDIAVTGIPVTEAELTIHQGYGVYGIPLMSEELETMNDFFALFDYVWLIYYQRVGGSQHMAQYNGDDITVRGGTAYMINSSQEQTIMLEGEPWQELVPRAPQAIQMPRTLTTTWGEMKQ